MTDGNSLDNDHDQVCFSFACQVLEYHPQPWNQWVKIGDLQQARQYHATLSIGPELPCLLSGESFNIEIIFMVMFGNDDNENNDNQQ